jgi:hypothetical protein
MTYEERKAAYTAKAQELTPVPKDLKYLSKFNNLKMAVMEKVETDIKSGKINSEDAELLFTIRDKNDVFGFTERYLNVMMHYAFEEGKHSVFQDHARRTKAMNEAYEKIVDIMDGLDMIPENCTCDY